MNSCVGEAPGGRWGTARHWGPVGPGQGRVNVVSRRSCVPRVGGIYWSPTDFGGPPRRRRHAGLASPSTV